MRDIILVLSSEPSRLIRTTFLKEKIVYLDRHNLAKYLPVQIKFVSFRNGKCGVLLIAAERFVSASEALNLHYELDTKNNFIQNPLISLRKIK